MDGGGCHAGRRVLLPSRLVEFFGYMADRYSDGQFLSVPSDISTFRPCLRVATAGGTLFIGKDRRGRRGTTSRWTSAL
ncbi:hypothetical protein EKH55_3125 [Sinorhizobium alkalisoli]|nr:hypothetical protein EKH55_3125 [Sinorhizobium alkalisoli]